MARVICSGIDDVTFLLVSLSYVLKNICILVVDMSWHMQGELVRLAGLACSNTKGGHVECRFVTNGMGT
jgi:hypothetical protein